MRALFHLLLFSFLFLSQACLKDSDQHHNRQAFIFDHDVVAYYQNQAVELADSLLLLPVLSLRDHSDHIFADNPGMYVSLACYWWPDPSSKNGLPYIRIDGEINPETRSESSHLPLLIGMAKRVEIFAAAYNITGREVFAEKAAEQLFTWFVSQETAMLPHLNHAQMVKGQNTGRSYGVIDGWWLVRVLESFDYLTHSPHWSHELETGLTNWFSDFLHWLLTGEFGLNEIKSTNNHGTWYDVQIVAYSLFTGREELAKQHLMEISKKRLLKQFSPSGRQKLEMRRTRPLHYSIYNLAGQLKLAEFARLVGVEYGNNHTFFSSGLEKGTLYLIHALNGADITALSDPQDQTDIDGLYLYILTSAYSLYNHDVIKNEKVRYLDEQKFIHTPLLFQPI